jgi:hypothetical protein
MEVSMVVMFERLEKLPGATLIAFPPPIFAGIASISVFLVSLLPHLGSAQGGGVFILAFLGRILKRQNTRNKVFLFCRVITKISGIDGKLP